MAQRVFLTGCSGEIGSRLTSLLLEQGYEVFGVRGSKECTVSNPMHICNQVNLLNPDVKLGMQLIKPDVLVHAAWLTTPKEYWESDLNAEWVEASKRIIHEFSSSGGKYLVVTGSCAEYSWETKTPISESSLEHPTSSYGKAKLELLNWIRKQEIPFLWTRTFFQFGMNEPKGRLIPDIVDSLSSGKEFVVQSASDVRDFVFVEDVSAIISLLISRKQIGVVNIGSGEQIEIEILTRAIAELLEHPELLKFSTVVLPKSYVVSDPQKLRSIIGNYSWMPLESALVKTIEARNR
jgi:nucleoside-diphosphate-sugar epimerase